MHIWMEIQGSNKSSYSQSKLTILTNNKGQQFENCLPLVCQMYFQDLARGKPPIK